MTMRAFIAITWSIIVLVLLSLSYQAVVLVAAYFLIYPCTYIVRLCRQHLSLPALTIGSVVNIASLTLITTIMVSFGIWHPRVLAILIVCFTMLLACADIAITVRKRWAQA